MFRHHSVPRPTLFTAANKKKYVRVRFPRSGGKQHVEYFGADSPEAWAAATEAIRRWLANETAITPRAGITVKELIVAYLQYADGYYKPLPGTNRKSQLARVRIAMQYLADSAGDMRVDQFGPNALRGARDKMVESGKCRSYVNYLVSMILRAFRWGVSHELVPVDVHIRLATIEHLKKGRSRCSEGPGRTQPIPMADIQAAVPYLPEPVAGMVMMQLLAGMRPNEVLQVRAGDIHKDGIEAEVDGLRVRLWEYRPQAFKGDHLDDTSVQEVVMLGPKVQKLLGPLLDRCSGPDDYLFPSSRYRGRQAEQFALIVGGTAKPTDGSQPYTIDGYRNACIRACKAAGVPRWTPKRLRHTRATELRRLFKDADAAQAVLRHRHISTTERYAHIQLERAAEVMARVG